MNKFFTTKKMAYLAMFAALTAAVTFAVKIPMPATDGYLNIGDSVVFLGAALFGPLFGAIAGGVGSALADLISGYPHYILPTLIIKGAEGAVCGLMFILLRRVRLNRYLSILIAMTVSAVLMAVGYFFAAWAMYGSLQSALFSLPWNLLQGGVSLALTILLLRFLTMGKTLKFFLSDSLFLKEDDS